jgi:hypothetical protein
MLEWMTFSANTGRHAHRPGARAARRHRPAVPVPPPARGPRRLGGSAREVTSADDEHPVFSLRHLQDDFGLRQCTREEKAALADTFHRLSQLTWAQLCLAPRHGLGYERIASRAIRALHPHGVTEDVAYIAFRFHGLAPMVGYRTGAIFHLLWLDRAFTLYDHR